MKDTLQRNLGIATLFAVLSVASLGGWLLAGAVGGQGVGTCLSMHSASLCHTDSASHLASWQQFFSPTVTSFFVLVLLALCTLAVLVPFFEARILFPDAPHPIFSRWREAALFRPLHDAYLRGIVNGKAY